MLQFSCCVKNSQSLLSPPSLTAHSLLIPAGPAGRLSVELAPPVAAAQSSPPVSPTAAAAGRRAGDCGSLVGSQSGRSAVDTVDPGHTLLERERERERQCRDQQVGANPLSRLILDSKLITGGIILTGGGVRFHRLWRPQPIVRSCTDHVTRSDQWQARSWGVVSFMSSERRTQSARIKYCELTSSPRS